MSDTNRQAFLKHKRLISNSSKHCELPFRCKHQETFGPDGYMCRRRSQPFPLFSISWSLSSRNTKKNLQGLEWSPLSTPGFKTTPEASCIVTHLQKQAQEISLQPWVWLGRLLCLGGKAGSGMLHSSSTRTIGIAAQATAVLVLVSKPF